MRTTILKNMYMLLLGFFFLVVCPIMKMSLNHQRQVVAVIHSLSEYHPPHDPLLFFSKGDTLEEGGIDVVEAATIEETAFVLPCVQEPGDDFPMKHNMAKYFLVFPPRSEWTNIW
jgi:hypothetical protein